MFAFGDDAAERQIRGSAGIGVLARDQVVPGDTGIEVVEDLALEIERPEVGSRRGVIRDAVTTRLAAAESRALAAAQVADPGPHILLSDQLRARRAELRDQRAT